MKVFADLEVLSIPTTANFRGLSNREITIFRGTEGWSEFSPFLEYSDQECIPWMRASLEAAFRPWPELKLPRIKVNAILPKISPEKVSKFLKRYPGVEVIKIKVDDFENDSDLVEAALDYAPNAKIRLDVNGGWDLKTALLNLHDFHLRFGKVFEYIEQPCLDLADLKALKSEIPMKIAVDESIRKSLDTDFTKLRDYADVAVIKWQPVGGFSAATKIAKDVGLPIVISSALESGIGLSHGLALASTLNTELACGLATSVLLESNLVEDFSIKDGSIEVLKTTPNPSEIAKYRATEDRRDWWIERIKRVYSLGGFDELLD